MLLKYFYDKRLAQASYMVGCAQTGEALIVDPARDIAQYLTAAEENGLRITHITETHIHADFVSGARELAATTDAQLYLSDMGDADWKYAYADEARAILLRDGDFWMVGNVRVDVIHTPGHTPEHLAFLVTDTAGADRPIGMFTGDFVFVGDVGRPDLLETAAGFVGTKETGARQQFASVERLKAMPDYLQLWPGHGAGSACGKSLGAIPSTTLGYEKLFNPAFQFEREADFVEWLLDGQPEAPRYFAQMKRVNKLGPALLRDLPMPTRLDAPALDKLLAEGVFVADFRREADFAASFVPGTVSIPATSNYTTYVGWFVDYSRLFYFLLDDEAALPEILTDLRAIGVDTVGGYFLPDVIGVSARKPEALPTMSAEEAAARFAAGDLVIVDVRNRSEFEEKHVRGVRHIPLGYLPQHLGELPRDRTVVFHCASGYRSQIATSLSRAHGLRNVASLNEGERRWTAALPIERGETAPVGKG